VEPFGIGSISFTRKKKKNNFTVVFKNLAGHRSENNFTLDYQSDYVRHSSVMITAVKSFDILTTSLSGRYEFCNGSTELFSD
jgi:hypothetical protein